MSSMYKYYIWDDSPDEIDLEDGKYRNISYRKARMEKSRHMEKAGFSKNKKFELKNEKGGKIKRR
ncbi:hypothetical protein [Methanosarcina barkeri]|uniref:hypothetical protein n=1 Tax=Methanosarcina barkeri TaxID=2208 RepID=UPI000B10D6B0|nr:hypothetical protein [Methanosarcina barkeri]